MRALVVEDSEIHAQVLGRALSRNGIEADLAFNGADALRRALEQPYNFVILDWNLPDLEGVDVCRKLRESGYRAPILMLTVRSDAGEQVEALEAGADDYVIKPFELSVLLARIRALSRRVAEPEESQLQVGRLRLDFRARLGFVDGQDMLLTQRQFAILTYLAKRPDQVVTREELFSNVWGSESAPGSNVIEVHVRHLRTKLGEARHQLQTVRGAGYVLRRQADAPAED